MPYFSAAFALVFVARAKVARVPNSSITTSVSFQILACSLSSVTLLAIPCFQAGAVFCLGHLAVSSGEYAQIPKRYAWTCHLSFILCLYNLFKVAF